MSSVPMFEVFCCSLVQAHGTTLPWDPASLGALRHPNLVNVMGTTVAPVGGTNFLVVEAMPAGNMHEFMQNDLANVMTGAASFSAVMGIATGLQYLHESRPAIVHGDLRAEHVLLDEKLTAKVTCRVLSVALSTLGVVWWRVLYLCLLDIAFDVDCLYMSCRSALRHILQL